MAGKRITLAAIAGAHGIGGEVRLKLFARSIDSLKPHRAVAIGDKPFVMRSVRAGGHGAIAQFAGIDGRDAAEALRGQLLTVDRAALPLLEDGEYYHADLIGLECRNLQGERVGRVVGIDDYGAGDVLEIERDDGVRALVPFRPPAAVLIDDAVTVDPAFLA